MSDRNEWTLNEDGTYSRWMGGLHLIVDPYDDTEAHDPGWYGEVVAYSLGGGRTFESSVFFDTCYDDLADAKAETEKWATGILKESS